MKTKSLLLLACLIGAVNTLAVSVTFTVSGKITSITSVNGNPIDDFGVAIGDSYSTVITYDTTTPDGNPSGAAGLFGGDRSSLTMDTTLGGRVFNGGYDSINSRLIWTGDGDGIPGQTIGGIDAFRVSVEGPASQLADVRLTDSTATAFSSDGLPLSFNLSDWDGGRFTFLWGHTLMEGNISGLQTVPDAASGVLLFAIGLVACAGARTWWNR